MTCFFVNRDLTRWLAVGPLIALVICFALTTARAQTVSPTAESNAAGVPKSVAVMPQTAPAVALTEAQMQRLTIVQTAQRAASEELQRHQAEYRALLAEFRWVLGLNPAEYDGELRAFNPEGTVWGFVPKPRPAPVELPKEAKPEPKQTGKQE